MAKSEAVKAFTDIYPLNIEDEINKWLNMKEEHERPVEIVQIAMTAVQTGDASAPYLFAALVHYRPASPDKA